MSRRLLILRHAKSAWDTTAETDFDRPLTGRGKRDALKMGDWLREQGTIPDHVLSSPAKRAKQTAQRVCQTLGIEEQAIHWEAQIYEAMAGDLLRILAGCPVDAETVLLIGHNPALESLVLHLCGAVPIPEDGKLLPTATLAWLDVPVEWSRLEAGAASLRSITRPRSLAA